jgi:hypothetical protein
MRNWRQFFIPYFILPLVNVIAKKSAWLCAWRCFEAICFSKFMNLILLKQIATAHAHTRSYAMGFAMTTP